MMSLPFIVLQRVPAGGSHVWLGDCPQTTACLCSFPDGHSGCFLVLAIANNTAVNIYVQVFVFSSFGNGITGPCGGYLICL